MIRGRTGGRGTQIKGEGRVTDLTDTALAQSVARHADVADPRGRYGAFDLGHEAAGAREAQPLARRWPPRTRPYWNGVKRSEDSCPHHRSRNRRCRAARTPCRRRPPRAAHPTDPAPPVRFGLRLEGLDQHQRRVEVARPRSAAGSTAGVSPNRVQRHRHLRARRRPPYRASPVSTPRTLRSGPGARAHVTAGSAGTGDEPEDPAPSTMPGRNGGRCRPVNSYKQVVCWTY